MSGVECRVSGVGCWVLDTEIVEGDIEGRFSQLDAPDEVGGAQEVQRIRRRDLPRDPCEDRIGTGPPRVQT